MDQRRVLITGSSRGIGRAIALKLAVEGWQVAIHYRQGKKEADIVSRQLGDSFSGVYCCDLSQREQAQSLVSNVLKDGRLDALVNNAGIYIHQNFVADSDAEFEKGFRAMFALNFEAPMFLTREASRHFARQKGGKVLNVASRVGFKGEAGAAIYAATKAALINLTRSLSVELAAQNVQIFGIAPGWVETAMARPDVEARIDEILSGLPLGRMASPADCATVAAFLLSDEAKYLTGTTIDINGASYFH
jgi:3-oxoacyl-[acyl-carrier protein] reductase